MEEAGSTPVTKASAVMVEKSASAAASATARDATPSIARIEELARRILDGDIYLPKFQRAFVWTRPQILTLLDSVAKGYPIGSVLLWQTHQRLHSDNRIADLEIKLPQPTYPVNYLLDGQQRLSTICGALYWNGTDANSPWNLAYDLRTETFVHLDTVGELPLHRVRLNKLVDGAEYFKQVYAIDAAAYPDKAVLKQRADALYNRFKDYRIATVTLGDMTIDQVAPIFERINSEGTRLTLVDLMRAATWSPNFDLVDSIKSILKELEVMNYETVDDKAVLRNISAVAAGGFTSNHIDDLRKASTAQLQAAINQVKTAYMRTTDFLAHQVKIPSSKVLPYMNQVTILAEIFRQVPAPSAAQYAAISKWFWATSWTGYFRGWSNADMARDLKAVTKFTGGAATIEHGFEEPQASMWTKLAFRTNSAHSRLLAVLLMHHEPIDLMTGQKVPTTNALSWSNEKEFHHFFPKDYIAGKGADERVNSLANIVMITSASNKAIGAKAPSIYLKEVAKQAGPKLNDWLHSNLISPTAYAAALKDDFEAFLKARSQTIHEMLAAKVA